MTTPQEQQQAEEPDICEVCGWMCEYPSSHVRHSNGECGVLKQIYEITLDKEDGSLIMINLETGEETRDEL
jgi:hypothetical protein